MPLSRRLLYAPLLLALICLGSAVEARADIVVMVNTNSGGAPVNLTGNASATTVFGTTGSGHTVEFTGTTAGGGTSLEAENGAARITGPGDNNGDPNITSLTYQLQNNFTFTSTQFNVDATGDGFLQLTITGSGLSLSNTSSAGVTVQPGSTANTLILLFPVDGNGQNITNLLAINAQLITSVTISAFDGTEMDTIRQFRIDGVAGPVPEPATLMMLGTGLTGVAALARRRKRRPSSL